MSDGEARTGARRRILAALVVVAVVALLASAQGAAPALGQGDLTPRIVGGDSVSDDKYRFVAALLDKRIGTTAYEQQFCGGTLIDRDSVLTAAHCMDENTDDEVFEQMPKEDLLVTVGRTVLDSNQGQVRSVTGVDIHQRYVAKHVLYDVAVLQLDRPVTDIPPIGLPATTNNRLEADGRILTVAGWGATTQIGPDPDQNRMREAQVPVVADSTARQKIPEFVPKLMVAAGSKGKGACNGDSGGPLFTKVDGRFMQAGIASFATDNGCAQRGYPEVYTEVNNAVIRNFVVCAASDGQACAWTWGDNSWGKLGDGTTADRRTPVPVPGLMDATAVAGGSGHSLALKGDGTAWAWGHNGHGQLGDGTNANRSTRVRVRDLSGVVGVAGGHVHSLALKGDGTVWAWGNNGFGQLGDGTTTSRSTPKQVSGLSGVTDVADGTFYSLAVKNDGTVWSWGDNASGQLGDGTTINRRTPVQVSGLSGVIDVAGGDGYSLALKDDGTVWAWGNNGFGQLGDGTTTSRSTPVRVRGLSSVTDVADGTFYSLAVKNDGTVWSWGDNASGQLGDGTTTSRNTPKQVSGLSGVTDVAGGYDHSLALGAGGTVSAWGWNEHGQLGDGTTINRPTPRTVSGAASVRAVAASDYHSLAVR